MKFSLVKRLQTTDQSVFYSLVNNDEDHIIGFGRNHWSDRNIKIIHLNKNFDIISNDNDTLRGEDPRCFHFQGRLYVLDNYFNDMYLIDVVEKRYLKLNISGKNISFINYKDSILYFIHYIKPFSLYTLNIQTGEIKNVQVDDDGAHYHYEYRGGTPGYLLNDEQYYGYGHRTYHVQGVLTHDIFKWVVTFGENKLPRICHTVVEQPPQSLNICDPTSVIEVDGIQYLITAESNYGWSSNQDYVNNVYRIEEDK
jgi:hypothetical protein